MSFYSVLTMTFLSLFAMVNPIGMSSVFLGLSDHMTPKERHKLAYTVALYSTLLLIIILFAGRPILAFFGLSLPFIRIAGGLLVSFTAWQMLNAKPKLSENEEEEHQASDGLAFFPLTLPITAGAGAIAIVIAIDTSINHHLGIQCLEQYSAAILGILLVMVIVAACYRFSDTILNKLGATGTAVVTRLTAFVLLAIGIDITWEGILALIIIAKKVV